MHFLADAAAPANAASHPTRAAGNRQLRLAARLILGACLLTAASHLRLPFVGTPVPFTLGPQMALLLGVMLGAAEGAGAVASWMMAGLYGAPVFASGLTGVAALLGPTGGYLAAYGLASALVGRWGRGGGITSFMVWMSASLLILALGTIRLTFWLNPVQAYQVGFAPFVATDACKTALMFAAACALQRRAESQNKA